MAAYLERRIQERFGVSVVTLLHTRVRAEADADAFVELLRKATGFWILGGFPPNLVQAYLGTKTELEPDLGCSATRPSFPTLTSAEIRTLSGRAPLTRASA